MTSASSIPDTMPPASEQRSDPATVTDVIRNPFPGPQPYRAADSAVFFGREADALRFERHVLANSCTTLFGPSGSGKSSLVQAAVEPSLREKFGYYVVHIDTWRKDVPSIHWFVHAMCNAIGMAAPEAASDPLTTIDEIISRAIATKQRLFIFLDQLEQLLLGDREIAELLALLKAVDRIVQNPSPDLHVVLALREDYLGRFRDRARRYRMLLENSFRLSPLSVGAMTKAVCKAATQGMPPQEWPEKEAGDLMLRMCAQGQAPGPDAEVHGAFVQIVCRALWEQRRMHGARTPLSATNPADIVERHLQSTLRDLGAYAGAALRLLEDKLVDEHQNRTLLTEKEASAALPAAAAAEVLKKLESAAVLRAEAYQDGRFFQLGHDWLATQIFARRQRAREKAQKRKHLWTAIGTAVALVAIAALSAWTSIKRSRERLQHRQEVLLTAAFNVGPLEPLHSIQLGIEVQHNEDGRRAYTEATFRKALRTSRFRGMLIASDGIFSDARFLPDGKRVATIGAADGLALWDIATGRRLRAMYGDPNPTVLAVESSGRLAATAGALGSIDLWDLEQQQLVRSMRGHLGPVTAIAFNQDESLLASASDDGSALLWDVTTGSLRHQLIDHLGSVTGLAFSQDGDRLVTIGADRRTVLWDARSGKKLRELASEEGEAGIPAFSPTGRYLAIASGSTVVLRDPITQQLEGTLSHTNSIMAIAFSPDGDRIASVGFDGTLRIWSTATRAELSRLTEEPVLYGHDLEGPDHKLRLHQQRSVAFSADGRLLITTGFDGTAKLWAVDGGGEVAAFQAHTERIREIEYSPRGDRIATASADGTVAVWDTHGRLRFRTPRASDIRAIAFDPSGARLAATDGSHVTVWDATATRPSVIVSREESADVRDLRIYHHEAHDRIALVVDSRVIVRNLDDGREIFSLNVASGAAAVAISPNNLMIACECGAGADVERAVADHRLCVWNAENGKPIAALDPGAGRGHLLWILQLVFSPDGARLFSSSVDQSIKIWNVAEKRLQASLEGGHHESVTGLAVSNQGEWLATAGDDHLRIWNTHIAVAENRFPDAEPGASSVAFSPDQTTVAAGGSDGVVRVYSLDSGAIASIARYRVPFALPNADCRQYTQRGCQASLTPTQAENEGRWTLRTMAMQDAGPNPAVAGYIHDAARFQSARLVTRALKDMGLDDTERKLAFSAKTGKELAHTLASILEGKRKTVEEYLRTIGRTDRQAVIDPVQFSTRRMQEYLIAIAQVMAKEGKVEIVEALLGVVPGVPPDGESLHRLAGAMTTALTISSLWDKLKAGETTGLLEAVSSAGVPSRYDPRFSVFLRAAAIAYVAAKRPKEAAELAEAALRVVDNAATIIDLGEILVESQRFDKAEQAYRRVLAVDPMNNRALLQLGLLQNAEAQKAEADGHAEDARAHYEAAVATLQRISPWAAEYKPALTVQGSILYDKLKRPEDGYRTMVIAVGSRAIGDWANLAEAAWATGKLVDARLIAERVLDARPGGPAKLSVQLAMHFVRLAALAQAGDLGSAERELDALVQFVTDPEKRRAMDRDWSYDGTRDVVKRFPTGDLKDFVEALLTYVEQLGDQGSPEELRALLRRLATPAPPKLERTRPAGPAPANPAPRVPREVTAAR